MEKSKTYAYDYDQHENENKGAGTMVADILADPEFLELTELIIGSWGWACGNGRRYNSSPSSASRARLEIAAFLFRLPLTRKPSGGIKPKLTFIG